MSDGGSVSSRASGGSGTAGDGPIDVFAVIVGSGFAGLGMAFALAREGIHDFVVLEKSSTLGGTWRDNVYPGCACDVPSHLYSYSFAPKTDWTSTYASQPEIRAYTEACVDRFGVRDRVKLDTEVAEATFDEAHGLWDVTTAKGTRYRARIVVGGLGPLSRFSLPAIPGLDRFRGKVMHSASWDPAFTSAGKRIASIGTGASAIQYIPELAKDAAKLHVFQRTPAWVLPRIEHDYTSIEKTVFERVPGVRFLYRQGLYWSHELRALAFTYEPRALAAFERVAKWHIARSVKDPALRAKLTPDYRMGCKRILMSNTYYPALAQPNVEVLTDGIREITEHGIVGADGVERPIDALVFGTGFDVHDYVGKLRIRGRSGVELGKLWEKSPEAYLGSTVAGFPNLFMIVGPNTGLGHNSMIFMIESQVAHVMEHVKLLRSGAHTVEVREEVQREYNDALQAKLQGTVWQSGCKSWYLREDGRNATLWPGFTFEFRQKTRRLDPSAFRTSMGEVRAYPQKRAAPVA